MQLKDPQLLRQQAYICLLYTSIASQDTSLGDKKISAEAKNLILQHPWRGNVRELQSTFLRAALWCQGDLITAHDICLLYTARCV